MNTVRICYCVLILGPSILFTVNGNNPRSTSITISGRRIGLKEADEIAELIAKKSETTRITSLNLPGNSIEDEAATAIANFLPKTKITHLNLGHNDIGSEGAKSIANILKNTVITHLDLQDNPIRKEGARAIFDVLKDTAITQLNLFKNRITKVGITDTINALRGTRVNNLNLDENGIEDTGAEALASVLKDTEITTLSLQLNRIKEPGVKAIAGALKNSKLNSLDLKYNWAGDEGVKTIAEALKDSKINSLNLAKNGITDVGAKTIATVLKDSQIIKLNLANNKITDMGGKSIAKVLGDTLITDLSVRDNTILMDTFVRVINAILKNNEKKVIEMYQRFEKLVKINENGDLEFNPDGKDYIGFTKDILHKKQSWINHLISKGGSSYGKHKIEDFIENILVKLGTVIPKLNIKMIDRVKLLLTCEKEGLNVVVEELLNHRPDYWLRQDEGHTLYGILHPAVYILMDRYKVPWYFEGMKPTIHDLKKIFQSSDWDDDIQEDQLAEFSGYYGKKNLLEIIEQISHGTTEQE